jgi:hypothetical protein
MMATEAEIEAACRAFHSRETPSGMKVMGWDDYSEGVRHQCRLYMRAALEAAESVRASDQPLRTEIVRLRAAAHADGFWKGRLEAAGQMRKKDEETARLRAELEAFNASEQFEIARLREALEKIASCGDAGWVEDYGGTAVEYARAALAPESPERLSKGSRDGPTSKPRLSFCQAEFSACEFPECACPEKTPHIQAHGPFPGAPFKP